MKIAQVAPLYEAVPPRLYGGTERIVYYLTEELVRQGHEVTLFASGDSTTSATLIPIVPEALRLKKDCEDMFAPHIVQMQEVIDRVNEFDIIHFHTDYIHFPFSQHLPVAHVTTLHGKLSIPELQLLYNRFSTQPVISISHSQRHPLPQANWVGTVHHGLPVHLHTPGDGDGGYLAFLGRISPEKGVENAIRIARAAGVKLKIAAKVDKADEEYYHTKVRHLIDGHDVEFVGEVNEHEKTKFLGGAKALLFPINWNEPFGIVLIEAMACGTPVIAFPRGSVPEVICDGISGLTVASIDEAIEAVNKVGNLNRHEVRRAFENYFTSERMAKDYTGIYEKLIAAREKEMRLESVKGQTIPMHTDDLVKSFVS